MIGTIFKAAAKTLILAALTQGFVAIKSYAQEKTYSTTTFAPPAGLKTVQEAATNLSTLIVTINQYGDKLTYGAATAADQKECSVAVSQLKSLATEAQRETLSSVSSAKVIANQLLRATINSNVADLDVNPCPTQDAFILNGRQAFAKAPDQLKPFTVRTPILSFTY